MKRANSFKKIASDENAVSPVIGVILMVAVTVILAAVIAAFVFGFAGNMPKSPNVAYYKVERTADKQLTIINNCPLIADLTNVHVYIGGVEVDSATTLSGHDLSEYGESIVIDYALANAAEVTTTPTANAKCSLITSDPMEITIEAQVNGAPIQVVQTITV